MYLGVFRLLIGGGIVIDRYLFIGWGYDVIVLYNNKIFYIK